MADIFTSTTLPQAVRWPFETNGYTVTGPVQVSGAEVDLIATQLTGLERTKIYIEVTVEHVDNAKFAKDLTKLNMFQEPGSLRLIVSSQGFTAPVRERAEPNKVLVYTYDELFSRFEQTEPYTSHVLGDTEFARSLAELDAVYEEPMLDDASGRESATQFMDTWLAAEEPDSRWLILVGEYGTGKTALTRVLQRRWTEAYVHGSNKRLPFRVELRDFAKQFDARGLLHHFLDRNELSHLPVAFVESMIANGRVVLLLDGYDEMAQYLNVRERRACLEALADLARDGARGILTSRPNYFTEAEELRVFEVLYKRLSDERFIRDIDRAAIDQEKNVDRLLEQFVLRRLERRLRDLTPEQTRSLIERRLAGDAEGAEVILGLLNRIFRPEEAGSISLAGKPVIVSYLVEVVEQLKSDSEKVDTFRLTEWQVYELILHKLMQRDFARTPELLPSERQDFLERLALDMTTRQSRETTRSQFESLTEKVFATRLARRKSELDSGAKESLIDDLRSSSTLTRVDDARGDHLTFSHNSLREFLLVRHLTERARANTPEERRIGLTDLMFTFARTIPSEVRVEVLANLSAAWPSRTNTPGWPQVFNLLWEAVLAADSVTDVRSALSQLVGPGLDVSGVDLYNIDLSAIHREANLNGLNATNSELTQVNMTNSDFTLAKFSGAALDACVLRGTTLDEADFSSVLMLDCDLTHASLHNANFSGMDADSTAIIKIEAAPVELLQGDGLRGYLKSQGALVDTVDDYFVFSRNSRFVIAEKICRVLADGAWHQRRGLEQRGAAEANIPYAREFVAFLLRKGLASLKGGGGQNQPIGATPDGKQAFALLIQQKKIPPVLADHLQSTLS